MLLNPHIDIGAWASALAENGRVMVPELLQVTAADQVETCLKTDVPWNLAYHLDGQSRTMPSGEYQQQDPDQRRRLLDRVVAGCHQGFSFAYETYMMVPAYLEKRDPDLLLHRLTEFLNTPEFIAFCRELTGDSGIRKLDAQATCYRPGHFLRAHDDRLESEGRLYAYVLGLTRHWAPDWGGLLQFLDSEEQVLDTFVPRFNALSVFKVPAFHCVTLVAPWAEAPRYSITGWMRT